MRSEKQILSRLLSMNIKQILLCSLCLISLYLLVKVGWGSVGFWLVGSEIFTSEPYRSAVRNAIYFLNSDNGTLNMVNFSVVVVPLATTVFLSSYAVIKVCLPALKRLSFTWFSLAVCILLVIFTLCEILHRMDSPADVFWYDFTVRGVVATLRLIVAWIIAIFIENRTKKKRIGA